MSADRAAGFVFFSAISLVAAFVGVAVLRRCSFPLNLVGAAFLLPGLWWFYGVGVDLARRALR